MAWLVALFPLRFLVETGGCHAAALPSDQHEHVGGACIFGSHALDFNRFSFEKR